jgi:hypothetical protein
MRGRSAPALRWPLRRSENADRRFYDEARLRVRPLLLVVHGARNDPSDAWVVDFKDGHGFWDRKDNLSYRRGWSRGTLIIRPQLIGNALEPQLGLH